MSTKVRSGREIYVSLLPEHCYRPGWLEVDCSGMRALLCAHLICIHILHGPGLTAGAAFPGNGLYQSGLLSTELASAGQPPQLGERRHTSSPRLRHHILHSSSPLPPHQQHPQSIPSIAATHFHNSYRLRPLHLFVHTRRAASAAIHPSSNGRQHHPTGRQRYALPFPHSPFTTRAHAPAISSPRTLPFHASSRPETLSSRASPSSACCAMLSHPIEGLGTSKSPHTHPPSKTAPPSPLPSNAVLINLVRF